MRKNMGRVIEAFKRGESATGDSKNTCSTDGTTVYSYRMPVARRLKNGRVQIVAYSASPTRTTTSQIHALMVAFPDAAEVKTLDPSYTFRSLAGDSGYQDRKPARRAPVLESGYVHCRCRDCFDVAITSGGPALCHACRSAGCDANEMGNTECSRADAYAGSESE
jgi:hypothetical protein